MKQKTNHPSGGKFRALFCMGLTAVLAAGIALNSTAATVKSMQYDVSVRSSSSHTAALSGDSLYVWGVNSDGQFPGSSLSYSPEPIQVQSGIADAAVSANRTLTVSTRGELRSYGVEPATDLHEPKNGRVVAKDVALVAASDSFAAYVTKSGALYTWGKNEFSQLGNGSAEASSEPVQILESGVKKVSLGASFGLALMEDGSVYGWGNNNRLQLGYSDGDKDVSVVSAPVKIAEDVKDISAGAFHSCLLKKNGSLWTCGDNSLSQTGTGDTLQDPLTQVMTGVRSVSAGSYHNFAVSTDGTVYAWGYGISGQLGNGGDEQIATPTVTSFPYVQVFACNDNTFGIDTNGDIYSFGDNTNYRLGKSNGSDSALPVRILDQNMTWVYTDEPVDNDDHHHGADVPPVTTPDVSDEPVTDEPVIVCTPFVNGYTDGTFQPDRSVSRAEFVKMLVAALGEDFDPEKNYGTCSFSDVHLGGWYENYVAYAEQRGIVTGYQDGTFHPNDSISRAEASKMTAVAMGLDVENAPSANFEDVAQNSWETDFINALANEGVLNGDGRGHFRPTARLSRSEAVKMISSAAGFKPDDTLAGELAGQFSQSPFRDVSIKDWSYVYILRSVGYVDMPETEE